MKRNAIPLLCWLGLWATVAGAYEEVEPFIQAIDQAMNTRCLDKQRSAVRIVRVADGKPIYQRNDQTPLLPASLVKLVTTAAALHYLGPDYRFKTTLLHSGAREGVFIKGDLILRGGGDPSLQAKDLWAFADWLKKAGVQEIQGDLIGEISFFDHYDRAPAWEEVRSQRAYDAKLSALSINFNTVEVHLLSGAEIGLPVHAWLEPHPAHYQLDVHALTRKFGTSANYWAKRQQTEQGVTIRLEGKLPEKALEQVIRLNIPDPALFALASFRQYLTQQGIVVYGQNRITALPPAEKPVTLYQHQSMPLSVILKELNTFSNNFMAEQIVKTIAAQATAKPGSHGDGLALIQAYLGELGVSTQGLQLVDGSGLSRQNSMSAQTLTDLLLAILPKFDMAPDFLASLRIMGTEGSPRSRRFSDEPLGAQIRAKTGTLYKVSNLAGLVPSEKGQLFAYAVLLNNNECGGVLADKIENRVLLAIHNLGEKELPANELSSINGIWPQGRLTQIQTSDQGG